jgi:hypothetical protein
VDPGCLSRIPDPDFYPSRIRDPTTAPKEEGKIFFPTIFVATNIIKIVNNFIFEQVKNFFAGSATMDKI